MAILVLATAIPIPVLSQTGVVVQGRVIQAGGTAGIQNARVELEGHGATLTSAEGAFRFEGVESGGYTLRVDAFGYASEIRFLAVDRDTTLTIPLEAAALPLDSLLVELRTIDIDGRVRDGGRDLSLGDADVLTDQGRATRTDVNGRFSLDDVLEEVLLRVRVQAFGYLPLDTLLVPNEDESYVFELESDPLVERMIEVQVRRIEERSAPRLAVMRQMNRERLLRWAGHSTLRDVIESEYRSYIGRIACVIIDEEQILGGARFLHILGTTTPEETERVEFLFRGRMLRIYTREFIRDMVSSHIELRPPVYVGGARPPLCR